MHVRSLPVLLGLAVLLSSPGRAAQAPAAEAGPFLDADAVGWKVNAFAVARWKTLVGGDEGGQIDDADVRFGLWELAPRAIYHGHRHDVPEIYFVTAGRARWTVGDVTREIGPGTVVRTPPGAIHRMENLGEDPVEALWFWWAPDGRREVFSGTYEFTEPAPEQPPGAGFREAAGEVVHP